MTDADTAKALFSEGLKFLDAGDFASAELRFRDTLKLLPRSVPTLTNLAIVLFAQHKIAEARQVGETAVSIDGKNVEAHLVVANCLAAEKKFPDVLSACARIIAIDPGIAEVYCNQGSALNELKQYDAALASYEQAVQLAPRLAAAQLGRGNVLAKLKRHEEALTSYDGALNTKPDFAAAWLGRAAALADLNRNEPALAAYDQAIKLKPDMADAWIGRGTVLVGLRRHDDALAAYDHALGLMPENADALFGRAHVFYSLARYDDALAAYEQALQRNPDLAMAWFGRGNAFLNLRRHEEAIAAYDRAIAIAPELDYAQGNRLHAKLQICDWENFSEEYSRVLAALRNGARVVEPFVMLALPSTPADQHKCASQFSRDRFPAAAQRLAQGARYPHERIRVGYLSADLREHPVAHQIAGVFEQHDRKQFEITAISLGADDGSEIRARLQRALHRFIDVRARSDFEVARLLRELEIDIVVDLMGYTADSRPGILAHRGAPIQASFLGYAGTMGADYVDYVIGDRIVIPADDRPFFSENVVHLPDSFFPTDSKSAIADATPARRDCSLPEEGFVFCAFNNTYKLAPEVFGVWMRLLREIEGSVLWLSGARPAAQNNLKREAENQGVSAERLVFAGRTERRADHLARHRLADLFLDTLPYNAHTSASDALWAGLPVLTCRGATFAGRVAASLLDAAGLSELVTHSLDEYEAVALKLARAPALLSSLKAKLAGNRDSCPLFNTDRFTRHLEAAYKMMWERHQREEQPTGFSVKGMGTATKQTTSAGI